MGRRLGHVKLADSWESLKLRQLYPAFGEYLFSKGAPHSFQESKIHWKMHFYKIIMINKLLNKQTNN